MAQANQRFECEGCGQRFESREELDQHMKECVGMKGSQGPKTRTAGGRTQQE